MFQALKTTFKPDIQLAKLSFKTDGGIRSFNDKEHLRKFMTTKAAPPKILKAIMEKMKSIMPQSLIE